MSEWTEMFRKDPDLGIMEQAYTRLKSQSKHKPDATGGHVLIISDPSLQAPSKPVKREITDVDRQKEEEELQMALALSIKDRPSQSNNQRSGQDNSSSAPAT